MADGRWMTAGDIRRARRLMTPRDGYAWAKRQGFQTKVVLRRIESDGVSRKQRVRLFWVPYDVIEERKDEHD